MTDLMNALLHMPDDHTIAALKYMVSGLIETIEGLSAECDRLKRERSDLRLELRSWKDAHARSQAHANHREADIARLRKEVKRLRPLATEYARTGRFWEDQAGGMLTAEVDELLAANKKIQAIKLVREKLDVGLREAKDIVEAREELYHGDTSEAS